MSGQRGAEKLHMGTAGGGGHQKPCRWYPSYMFQYLRTTGLYRVLKAFPLPVVKWAHLAIHL